MSRVVAVSIDAACNSFTTRAAVAGSGEWMGLTKPRALILPARAPASDQLGKGAQVTLMTRPCFSLQGRQSAAMSESYDEAYPHLPTSLCCAATRVAAAATQYPRRTRGGIRAVTRAACALDILHTPTILHSAPSYQLHSNPCLPRQQHRLLLNGPLLLGRC